MQTTLIKTSDGKIVDWVESIVNKRIIEVEVPVGYNLSPRSDIIKRLDGSTVSELETILSAIGSGGSGGGGGPSADIDDSVVDKAKVWSSFKTNQEISNVNNKVAQVEQSVSSGKQKVAIAITDKGVLTNSNDTFDTMASNIKAIVTSPSLDISYEEVKTGKFMDTVKVGDTVKCKVVTEGLNEVLTHPLTADGIGHTNSSNQKGCSVAWSVDNQYLFYGSKAVYKLYRCKQGVFSEMVINEVYTSVMCGEFSRFNNRLYIGLSDGTVAIYNVDGDNATLLTTLSLNTTVASIDVHRDYVCMVTASTTDGLHVFKIESDAYTKIEIDSAFLYSTISDDEPMPIAVASVNDARFDKTGEYLIVGLSAAPWLVAYKVEGDVFTRQTVAQSFAAAACHHLKFTPDGSRLIFISGLYAYPFKYSNGTVTQIGSSRLTVSVNSASRSAMVTNDLIVGHGSYMNASTATKVFEYNPITNTYVANTSHVLNANTGVFGMNASYDMRFVVKIMYASPYIELYRNDVAETQVYKSGGILDSNYSSWGYVTNNYSIGETGEYLEHFRL